MTTNEIINGLAGIIKLGDNLFVATVTYHYMGNVKIITDELLVLDMAIISADLGNYETFLKTKKPTQSEKIGEIIIFKQSIVSIIILK